MNELTFTFDTVEYRDPELLFHYSYRDASDKMLGQFTEKYVLPISLNTQDSKVSYILQIMHLVAGISYYKSLLGDVRHHYKLTPSEADYLNHIYNEGLGEYAFINKVPGAITPFAPNTTNSLPTITPSSGNGALLGIGGGKDSIVTAELMKALNIDTTVFDVATRSNHGQAGAVMHATGLPELGVERYVDAEAINLINQENNGKNGHVPLSVILAWVGILLAAAHNKRYIVMANEAATSSGNVWWNNQEINHQWAKSYDAERLTQDFVRAHISKDVWYFSPIRPYSSLAVMELFARNARSYFGEFTSCNLVLRINPAKRPNGRWCTKCAKCLSTWLLLSAWLSSDQLQSIFGTNLFNDVSLRPVLEALLGLSGHKPLDCVGTTEELRAVTRKSLESDKQHPLLQNIVSTDIPGPSIEELIALRSPANIPPELEAQIRNYVDTQLQK